jgi:hypothetical protein
MKFKIDDLQVGAMYLVNYIDIEDSERNYSGPGILQLTEGLNDLYFFILNDKRTAFMIDERCVFGLEDIVRKIDLDSITAYL